jgi:hypothetical protein
MQYKESLNVIDEFGRLVKDVSLLAIPKSLLPCSTGKIKSAFFNVVEYLITNNDLTADKLKSLIVCYGEIGSIVNDADASIINNINSTIANLDNVNMDIKISMMQSTVKNNNFQKYQDFLEQSYQKTSPSELADFAIETAEAFEQNNSN